MFDVINRSGGDGAELHVLQVEREEANRRIVSRERMGFMPGRIPKKRLPPRLLGNFISYPAAPRSA